MTIYSAITNPDTILTKTKTSTYIRSDTSSQVCVTFDGMPVAINIKSIKITKTTAVDADGDLKIYDTRRQVLASYSCVFNGGKVVTIDTGNLYYQNDLDVGFLYMGYKSTGAKFADGDSVKFEVTYTKSSYDTDASPYKADKTLRILSVTVTDEQIRDITRDMQNNIFSDYSKGSKTTGVVLFDRGSDALYIGSATPFAETAFEIMVGEDYADTGENHFKMNYWDGTTWQQLSGELNFTNSDQDNTDFDGYNSLFEYSGTLQMPSIAAFVGWTPSQLSEELTGITGVIDPEWATAKGIEAGTTPVPTAFSNPERYWVQIVLDDALTSWNYRIISIRMLKKSV